MTGMAALRRSVVSPAGRHTASLIFLHGSGAQAAQGRGAGQGFAACWEGRGEPPSAAGLCWERGGRLRRGSCQARRG